MYKWKRSTTCTQEGRGHRRRERGSVPFVFGDGTITLFLVDNDARQKLVTVLFRGVFYAIDCMFSCYV
jgi:hypothetical protein